MILHSATWCVRASSKYALVLLLVNIEPRLERRKSCLCECLGWSQALLFATGSLSRSLARSLGGCTSAACALSQPIPALRHSTTLRTEFSVNTYYPLFEKKVSPNVGTFYYLTWNVNRHKAVLLMTSSLQLSPVRPVQAKRHFSFHHDLSTTLTIHAGALTG